MKEVDMKKLDLNEKLKIEKEKLNRLADEALKKDIPLTQDEAFMAQNRKVDALVVKIIKEQERHRKKQRER
jgi:hypothetical protein